MSTPYDYIVNPNVFVSGVYTASSKLWACELPSAIYDRLLMGLTLQGPANSRASLYRSIISTPNLLDQTNRGQVNTADYSGGPMFIQRGEKLIIQWTPLGAVFTGTEMVTATFRVRQA